MGDTQDIRIMHFITKWIELNPIEVNKVLIMTPSIVQSRMNESISALEQVAPRLS